jgi:hypothetical protein
VFGTAFVEDHDLSNAGSTRMVIADTADQTVMVTGRPLHFWVLQTRSLC